MHRGTVTRVSELEIMDEEAIDGPTSSTRQHEPRWLTKAFKHRQLQEVGKEEILGDGVVEPLDGRRNGMQSRLARYACGVVWVVSLVAAVVVAVLSVSKRDGEGATTHEMLLGATLVADKRSVASLAPPTPLPASSPRAGEPRAVHGDARPEVGGA